MGSTNERWCYVVTSSLIGWSHTQNDPCCLFRSGCCQLGPWRRNDMETLSTLLPLCEGNPPVTNLVFDDTFVVRQYKPFSKQSRFLRFEMSWCSFEFTFNVSLENIVITWTSTNKVTNIQISDYPSSLKHNLSTHSRLDKRTTVCWLLI